MPRNVRNFWISTDCDARARAVETGPRRKDGGFDTTIYFREDGCVSDKRVRVWGSVMRNGKLGIFAEGADGTRYTLAECER